MRVPQGACQRALVCLQRSDQNTAAPVSSAKRAPDALDRSRMERCVFSREVPVQDRSPIASLTHVIGDAMPTSYSAHWKQELPADNSICLRRRLASVNRIAFTVPRKTGCRTQYQRHLAQVAYQKRRFGKFASTRTAPWLASSRIQGSAHWHSMTGKGSVPGFWIRQQGTLRVFELLPETYASASDTMTFKEGQGTIP